MQRTTVLLGPWMAEMQTLAGWCLRRIHYPLQNNVVQVVAILAVAMIQVGCGSGVMETTVGGSAREKCRAIGLSDAFIDAAFVEFRAYKAEGISAAELIVANSVGCHEGCGPDNISCVFDCKGCVNAIIDQVYGD